MKLRHKLMLTAAAIVATPMGSMLAIGWRFR